MSPSYTNLVFDDAFAQPEVWGHQWIDDWFQPGAKMNGTVIQPRNVVIQPGLSLAILNVASDGTGAVMSTNPKGGAAGFTFRYGRLHFRAKFDGVGWSALWTDGQVWPHDGENDVAEWLQGFGITSNYHSLGPTPNPPNDVPNNSGLVPGVWAGGWHSYDLYRNPGENIVYWDGKLVRRYPTYDGGAPHYILMSNTGSRLSELRVSRVKVWI